MTAHVKKPDDRRIQKTHNLLRTALVSLIAEKPYDSIVVKQILDRANVGRSTFYMHFRDKDDLLVSGIQEMLGPLPPVPRPSPGKGQERILWFALPVFEYHRRHAHPWNERIGARGRATMHEHLRRILADVIANVLQTERRGRHGASNILADLLSKYLAAAFVLVLDWWMDNGVSLPPREVNDLFLRLVSPAVATFLAVKP
jgi:AcrR family transcriptional regulator